MNDENSIASKTNGKINPPWRHKFITPKKQKQVKKSWLDETPAFLRYNTYPSYYSSILKSCRKPRDLSYEAMRNLTAVIACMEDNGRYLFEESLNNFETQTINTMTTASLFEKENEIQRFVESIFQNDYGEISSSSRRSYKILDNIIIHKKMNEEDIDVIRNGIKIAIQKCAPIVPLELQKQCLEQIGSNRPSNYPTGSNNVQISRRPGRPPESRHDHHGEDRKATTRTKTTTDSLGICYFLSHPKWTDPNLILFTTLIQHACKMMKSSDRLQPSQEQGGGKNKHILTKVATDFFALVCCDKNIITRTTADGPSFVVSSFVSNLFSRRRTMMKRRAFKKILRHFLSPYDNHEEYNNAISSSRTNNEITHGNDNMSCTSNNDNSKIDKKLASENNSSRSDTSVLLHQHDRAIRRGETASSTLLSHTLVQNSSSSILQNASSNTGATRSQEEQNMSSISTGNNNSVKKSRCSKNCNDKQENEEYDTSPIYKKVLFADDDLRNSPSSKEPNKEEEENVEEEEERCQHGQQTNENDTTTDADRRNFCAPYSIKNKLGPHGLLSFDDSTTDITFTQNHLSIEQQNDICRKWKEDAFLIRKAKLRIKTADAVLQEFNNLCTNSIKC
jgi:hypothetical protein